MKFGEDGAEVNHAFAHDYLFAQLVGVLRPEAIFGMDIADIGANDVDRSDWIGLAVKN